MGETRNRQRILPFTNKKCWLNKKEMYPKFHTCAPLLLCPVGSDHPGVEPLCPFTTVHCGGSDHPGVELLCLFSNVHFGGSDHPGVEPLCLFSNVHCGGNDHPGVEPLCPFTTVHSRQ